MKLWSAFCCHSLVSNTVLSEASKTLYNCLLSNSIYHSQPPKKSGKGKKGKKKKSAKSKTPTVIDGISTEEMTKEQVE